MEHTPLPWMIDARSTTHIVGANSRHVASTGGYSSNLPEDRDTYTDENDANAAFIVHAVNAHQALVEALDEIVALSERRVFDEMERLRTADPDITLTGVLSIGIHEMRDVARAALKQARGEV